jgi:hypothetical protein
MADLPKERLEPSPLFTHVGMDSFGPFTTKVGRKEQKRYGLIMTCLASKAIHIELLDDLTTDAFINALRCITALRGPIRTIRCDQGTNFIGAANIFEKEHKRLQNHLLEKNCEFIFNSPSASHMGGIWERQIRTIKNILSSMLVQHGTKLDSSTLRTLLYETVTLINCRPLTVDNLTDPNGPEPLTPNHLLTMKTKLLAPPPGQFTKEDVYAKHRWRRVQYLVEEF